MRSLPLPFLVVLFVATACSTPPERTTAAHYRTGTISSKWGELPTYSPTPEPFTIRIERSDPNLSGEAVVDLLVERDGRVKDWHVVSSPDNHSFQRGVAVWLRDFRVGPRLAESEPAPYVLRIAFVFIEPAASRDQYHQARGQSGPW